MEVEVIRKHVAFQNKPSNFKKQAKARQKDSQFPIHLATKNSLSSLLTSSTAIYRASPDCCPFSTQDAGRPQRWQYNAISLLSGSFNKTSMLKVGLNDLRELFQPEQYSDSIPFSQDGKGAKSFISPSLFMLNWKNWT